MISFVIPLRNEAENLAGLHAEWAAAVDSAELGPVEILFVDDGSDDGSWEVVERLALADDRVRGIRFRRNFGKAAALSAGFLAATGSIVFTLDGDLQDDPAEVPRFLARLDEGYDLVSGWKRKRHDPWHKVGPSRVFNWLVSHTTGCHLHDHNCGYKVYKRDVIDEVRIYGELHRFVPALAHAKGFRVGEIEVNHRARRFGASKYGVSRFLKGLLDLATVRFLSRYGRRPLHPLGTLGLTAFGLGTTALVATAVAWGIVPRPASLLVPVALGATLAVVGVQLFGLGLLAELVVSGQTVPADTFSVAETIGGPHPHLVDSSAGDAP